MSGDVSAIPEGPVLSIHQILYADNPNLLLIPHQWAFMNISSPDGGLLHSRVKISRSALHDQQMMFYELLRLGILTDGEVVIEYLDSFTIRVSSVENYRGREVARLLFTMTPAL
jgi:hypothetical protein